MDTNKVPWQDAPPPPTKPSLPAAIAVSTDDATLAPTSASKGPSKRTAENASRTPTLARSKDQTQRSEPINNNYLEATKGWEELAAMVWNFVHAASEFANGLDTEVRAMGGSKIIVEEVPVDSRMAYKNPEATECYVSYAPSFSLKSRRGILPWMLVVYSEMVVERAVVYSE